MRRKLGAIKKSEGRIATYSTRLTHTKETRREVSAVRVRLLAMQKKYLIELGDAAIAVKDDQGRIKLNQLINTTTVRCGLGYVLGYPHWPDLFEAFGQCGPRRSVRHAWRIPDRCWHRRQMDEGDRSCHPARLAGFQKRALLSEEPEALRVGNYWQLRVQE